jgi:PAS domain S-box-containing protein
LEKGKTSGLECEYQTFKKVKFWGKGEFFTFEHNGKEYYFIRIEKMDRLKQAERTLVQEHVKFEAFMEHASSGVLLINQQGVIIASNRMASELFGYPWGSLNNNPFEILVPENIRYKHKIYESNFFKEAESRPMKQTKEVTGLRKDGSLFPVEVKLGTYKNQEELFVIAFLNDISDRIKSEHSIRNLNLELEQKIRERTEALAATVVKLELQIKETEEAEKELEKMLKVEKHLNELKTRFVSIASHEFKTPLSTILSSAYLVQMYTHTDEQSKRDRHIERIVHSVNNLTGILNEFLNLGKLEEGKMNVKPTKFNFESLVKEIINDCSVLLKDKQEIIFIHNGHPEFFTDFILLNHIIVNLLSNAIKFSQKGTFIQINSSIFNDLLKVSIQDQGIGIPEEDLANLFERFFRGSNAVSIQGTGLGLHIVSRYSELLEGKISCKSKLKQGTEFIIEIPKYHES